MREVLATRILSCSDVMLAETLRFCGAMPGRQAQHLWSTLESFGRLHHARAVEVEAVEEVEEVEEEGA
jgi:hypothetical protein